MAGLGSQYITIDNVPLPETASFDIDVKVIEDVFQTEAGTDVAIVTRYGKHTINLAWEGATATFKNQAEAFCSQASVTVAFESSTWICRARDLKEKLVRYSNRYNGSKGLWDISFTLEEM